jgi:hypothetical protein
MADAMRGGIPFHECRPICSWRMRDLAMIEILAFYQLARNPMQAMARRWWCRSLFRASRGRRRCPECTAS